MNAERFGLFASGLGLALIIFTWDNEMWVALTLTVALIAASLFIMFLMWALDEVQSENRRIRNAPKSQGFLRDALQPPYPDGTPYRRS